MAPRSAFALLATFLLLSTAHAFPAALSLVPHLRAPSKGGVVSPVDAQRERQGEPAAIAVALPLAVKSIKFKELITPITEMTGTEIHHRTTPRSSSTTLYKSPSSIPPQLYLNTTTSFRQDWASDILWSWEDLMSSDVHELQVQWKTLKDMTQNIISQYTGGNTAGSAKRENGVGSLTLSRRVRTRDLLSKLFHLDLEESEDDFTYEHTAKSTKTLWKIARKPHVSGKRKLCQSVARSLQFRNGPPFE